jgi:hypothetical protein
MLTITKFPFGAWLQHYNEFPAYMDGVLFYIILSVFYLRASIVLDFLWIILMSERISGEARIATSFKKTTHNDLTVFALLVSVSAGLHFMGIRN